MMRSVVWGVGVYDPATMAGIAVTLSVITVLAAALPALRVARIDPALALRDE